MEKLIFLTLSLTRGGAERVICNMCNEYFVKHYEVTIISLMAAKPEYELDPAIRLLTIDTKEEQYQQNMLVRFGKGIAETTEGGAGQSPHQFSAGAQFSCL